MAFRVTTHQLESFTERFVLLDTIVIISYLYDKKGEGKKGKEIRKAYEVTKH